MKRFFSRIAGAALAASLIFTSLTPTALAAGITVTLDDQPMTFSDAHPLMRDDRTFVPFRAIFEGMGAQVGWDAATRTVTAKRGDRTVQLTIGRKAVTLDRAGADRSFSTDAAPFIEGGRTYVPVRFAAQALGAAVGWDGASQTVLLVDTEKMAQNTEFAGQFQALSSMLAFANTTAPTAPRALTGTLAGKMTFHTAMGDVPVVMNGSLSGTESLDAAQFSGTLSCDRSAIEQAITENEGANVIGSDVDALLKKLESISYDAILSRVDGKIYVKSDALTEFGIAQGKWAMNPLDQTDALTAVGHGDLTDLLCARAQQLSLTPGQTTAQVRQCLYGLSDYAADETLTELSYTDGTTRRIALTLSAGTALESRVEVYDPAQPDSAPVRTTISVLRPDGTTLIFQESLPSCSTELRLDLVNAGAGSAPAVRPA